MTEYYETKTGRTIHVLDPDRVRPRVTYCGRKALQKRGETTFKRPQGRACRSCRAASLRRLEFPFEHGVRMPTPASIAKAGRIFATPGAVVESKGGRVFRVDGSADNYTVLIHPELADSCTCLAGKVHPEVMCKHVAAAYLWIGNEDVGEDEAAA